MISSHYNRIILFILLTFTFTKHYPRNLPQLTTGGSPINPTRTSSSHLHSNLAPSSSTTTWTSASSTYIQILPGCCVKSNGIPGSCETQSTCEPQTGTPALPTTVPTSNPTVSATPSPSPSPSHSSGRRSMELDTSPLRSLAVLGLISMALSYLVF
ncbi:uncharacterized protein EAF02_002498 [Botrytis sinoallii]|uniref:uncharacterized protein n=1 Tax=Botrytis sinoallii TaxID=1463999 RepID=UPI0019005AF0|nr:uncharacterized protein EAF02_002498 [Botrytis sinoallii]KAF7890083.1 hypothetical protein EAF02_002498 [Botrytis sinoallii]